VEEGIQASDVTDAEEETADTGADDLVPVPGARFAAIPVGLVTGAVGGAYMLWLLRKVR